MYVSKTRFELKFFSLLTIITIILMNLSKLLFLIVLLSTLSNAISSCLEHYQVLFSTFISRVWNFRIKLMAISLNFEGFRLPRTCKKHLTKKIQKFSPLFPIGWAGDFWRTTPWRCHINVRTLSHKFLLYGEIFNPRYLTSSNRFDLILIHSSALTGVRIFWCSTNLFAIHLPTLSFFTQHSYTILYIPRES